MQISPKGLLVCLVLVLSILHTATSRPSGAPREACALLKPKHGGAIDQELQPGRINFTISRTLTAHNIATTYIPGEMYTGRCDTCASQHTIYTHATRGSIYRGKLRRSPCLPIAVKMAVMWFYLSYCTRIMKISEGLIFLWEGIWPHADPGPYVGGALFGHCSCPQEISIATS